MSSQLINTVEKLEKADRLSSSLPVALVGTPKL